MNLNKCHIDYIDIFLNIRIYIKIVAFSCFVLRVSSDMAFYAYSITSHTFLSISYEQGNQIMCFYQDKPGCPNCFDQMSIFVLFSPGHPEA